MIKETEGGNASMCKMMEDMRNEKAKDIAKNMLEENLPLETISKVTELPLEEVKKLKEEK